MQFTLTGHHVEITAALRDYVRTKLERVSRHFDHVMEANCILTVEKLQHKAEATVLVRGGKIYADAIEGDMYAAVDALVDKLDRRVKKYKEKRTDHHARDAHRQRFV